MTARGGLGGWRGDGLGSRLLLLFCGCCLACSSNGQNPPARCRVELDRYVYMFRRKGQQNAITREQCGAYDLVGRPDLACYVGCCFLGYFLRLSLWPRPTYRGRSTFFSLRDVRVGGGGEGCRGACSVPQVLRGGCLLQPD